MSMIKEFAEKLIEQLEEQKTKYRDIRKNTYCRRTEMDDCDSCRADHYLDARLEGISKSIEIINELSEEYNNGWILLTDDEESYPTSFEYVFVEDEYGDKNVACCYPDYDWYISNGENSLKLIGNVVKWKKLSD